MRERKIIILAIALVAVAASMTYYLLLKEREQQEKVKERSQAPVDLTSQVLEQKSRGEIEVRLYFYRPGAVNPSERFLALESRKIFKTEEPVLIARQIMNELFKGPAGGQTSLFPPQAHLRQLFILQDGTAVVDFTRETVQGMAKGITAEMALIRTVSRSLIENLPEVKKVRFLVEGHDQATLGGHVSIHEPFM